MTPEQAKELRKAFPASAVGKLPKGGMLLDYVGHAAVTDRLLAVDPEWTWKVTAPWPGFEQVAGVFIELTVGGVTRPGFGEATGGFSPGDKVKAAISDAIRNAAMRFGVALDLWSKEELEGAADADDGPHQPKAVNGGYSGRMASIKSLEYLEVLVQKAGFDSTSAFIESGTAKRLLGRDVRDLPNAEDTSALIEILKASKSITEITKAAPERDEWTATEPMASREQFARMDGAFHTIGVDTSVEGKQTRRDYISTILGRPIASASALTAAECSRVITALESQPTQGELT